MREKVLIRGAGEMASATAHRLFRCGYRVVMTEVAKPTAVRRAVAFCSAVIEGNCEVEGVRAQLHALDQASALAAHDWSRIPVFVDPECSLKGLWKPEVLVDARMLKRREDTRLTDAPLVIGLGPQLAAGQDVHFAVETQRGHHLGRIISEGMAAADTGEPGPIGGYTHERVVRAPAAGVFRGRCAIGDLVRAGDILGDVAGRDVTAGIAGVVRGIAMDGLEVAAGQKLGDIDPRADVSFCHSISDKARTIGDSVLEIVLARSR